MAGINRRIVGFPEQYVVLDLETTGLSPDYCSIIEISAIKVESDEIVDQFSTLVNSTDDIPDEIVQLTGITPEMLCNAPFEKEAVKQVISFIGDSIIVGHNVTFDIRFINSVSQIHDLPILINSYVDTLSLSRKIFPDLPNHKLNTLIKTFCSEDREKHRALSDVKYTNQCYLSIKRYAKCNNIDLKSLYRKKRNTPAYIRPSDIIAKTAEFNENSPIFEKCVVFTGALDGLTRREAMEIVVDNGGVCSNTVTRKTNYLVIASSDLKTNKVQTAYKLIEEGYDLEIISPDDFLDMVTFKEMEPA